MTAASLSLLRFTSLPGWYDADHNPSLVAFQRSAAEMLRVSAGFQRHPVFGGVLDDWRAACVAALANPPNAKEFFEQHFTPVQVNELQRPAGLFTGYFEPQAEASLAFTPEYPVPIYRKPPDLVPFTAEETAATGLSYGKRIEGQPQAYVTRQEIEQGALAGQALELAWLKDWADAFFIHIQGQGRLHFPDGTVMRLAYAAKSGRPYTGIGGVLVSLGEIAAATNSMQSIRRWMKDHPGQARELMWQNQSFVFFREVAVDDPEAGSLGAQRVNLTPRRSLAIDRHYWMFGTPLWLDTSLPPEAGGQTFRALMIAQDTGTAIKGASRGDVYWGWGAEAALIAGHMKSTGRLVALLPQGLAKKLAMQGQ